MNTNRVRAFLASDLALLCGLALIKLLIHWFTSYSYGIFRDELYYIAASERLQAGYLEFPPLVAYVAALARGLMGDSLFALRFFPALAGAVLVFVTGLIARELGGGRFAMALAALAALSAGVFLTHDSMLTMDPFDQLWWALAAFIVIRLIKTDNAKLWLAFGLVAGIGLLTKLTMLYLGATLVIGLLLTPARKYFLSKWLWLGGLVAFIIALPYPLWQAVNGFPVLDFWKIYATGKTYPVTPLEFTLQQILIMQPLTLPLWLTGLGYYLFAKSGRPYRALGITYVLLFGILMWMRAKNYFLAPAYPMLFAAGALICEQWTQRATRWHWIRYAYPALLILFGIMLAPLALPVLPVAQLAQYNAMVNGSAATQSERHEMGDLPQHFADRFGWPELAAQVTHVYQNLPPDEQAQACIFAGNYGEAGAISFYGKPNRLPPVISGHNQYFLWGPGNCTGAVMIVVGVPLSDANAAFERVEISDMTRCQYCMPYENGVPIIIGRGLKTPLREFWTRVRNFS